MITVSTVAFITVVQSYCVRVVHYPDALVPIGICCMAPCIQVRHARDVMPAATNVRHGITHAVPP